MAPASYIPPVFLTDFRDLCSGIVLSQIEGMFRDGGGFVPDESTPLPAHISGQRRGLVQQFYNGIDFTDAYQARRFLKVISHALAQHYIDAPIKESLRLMCKTAGFVVNGTQVLLQDHVGTDWLLDADAIFDREHFAVYCDRMQSSVHTDPSAAIGAAKELVESVCKYILKTKGETVSKEENLQALAKKAFTALDLTVESLPDAAKGADAMKKVLGSMNAAVQGLAELRNLYGSGHGRDGALRGVKPRHAKLAVGAATTLTTFLLETLEERQKATPT